MDARLDQEEARVARVLVWPDEARRAGALRAALDLAAPLATVAAPHLDGRDGVVGRRTDPLSPTALAQ